MPCRRPARGRQVVDRCCSVLARSCQAWESDDVQRLRESIIRHAGEGLTPTVLPSVSVLAAPATTAPLGDMVRPTFALVAQGAKQTALNGRPFRYGAGQFLVASVDLPVIGQIEQATPD